MKRITTIVLLVMLLALSVTPTSVWASDNFVAPLNGAEEAPVARDTDARGLATFKWNKEGTAFDYTLIAANIENVTAAHIHCGAAGVAGPVGVTLLHNMPPGGGAFDGVLAQATITAPDVPASGVNPCGWVTMADVFSAMNSGNTYVNVHTNDGVAPTNTGPGDFPGGEIRGQIH